MRFDHRLLVLCVAIGLLTGGVNAQFNSGSDGSDLSYNPQENETIDLSQAVTAAWDTPSPNPGKGVYDPEKWAIVFKYTSITIPEDVTVTFTNHPSGAPVVWLATGNVALNGTIVLDGQDGSSGSAYRTPGPGGFAGGRGYSASTLPNSAGFGPGGAPRVGSNTVGGGGYGSAGGSSSTSAAGGGAYGNVSILPLIGGSGGAGNHTSSHTHNGGAGGGAILIASSSNIEIIGSSAITADGGNGSGSYDTYSGGSGGASGAGSGGAIRLLANAIIGSGGLYARGGNRYTWNGYSSNDGYGGSGGHGRIRMEATTLTYGGVADPAPTYGAPEHVFPPSSAPTLRVTHIDGTAMPTDPHAGVLTPDVAVSGDNVVTIHIEAMNIPVDEQVQVHITPERGDEIEVYSTPLFGSFSYSTATVDVQLPSKRSEIHVRVNWTP